MLLCVRWLVSVPHSAYLTTMTVFPFKFSSLHNSVACRSRKQLSAWAGILQATFSRHCLCVCANNANVWYCNVVPNELRELSQVVRQRNDVSVWPARQWASEGGLAFCVRIKQSYSDMCMFVAQHLCMCRCRYVRSTCRPIAWKQQVAVLGRNPFECAHKHLFMCIFVHVCVELVILG